MSYQYKLLIITPFGKAEDGSPLTYQGKEVTASSPDPDIRKVAAVVMKENPGSMLMCAETLTPFTMDTTVYFKSNNEGCKDWPSDLYGITFNQLIKKMEQAEKDDRYIKQTPRLHARMLKSQSGKLGELMAVSDIIPWGKKFDEGTIFNSPEHYWRVK